MNLNFFLELRLLLGFYVYLFIFIFHLCLLLHFIAPGLLPTPDKSQMIVPAPESKGIFDPVTIQPGFVIDVQELWINEKISSDESQQSENRFKKRGRRPENAQRSRFQNEDGGTERGLQQNQEEYNEFHDEQMEPPEKRQVVQTSMQQGNFAPRHIDEAPKMRPPPMQFRGRAPNSSNNYPPYRSPAPFHPQSGPQEEHPLNKPADEDDNNEWGGPQGFSVGNRRGMPGMRGRGRGFGHSSVPRDPSMPRDNQYFIDEEGNQVPLEQHVEQPWRSRGRPNMEDSTFEEQEENMEWKNANFMPHQRRGPHPLLLRGHPPPGARRFPPPGDGRGMHFEGNGPPMRQGPPQRPPHPRHPLQEGQDMSRLSEQVRPANSRPYPKLRGLMDGIPRPSKEQWQGDRTGMGR